MRRDTRSISCELAPPPNSSRPESNTVAALDRLAGQCLFDVSSAKNKLGSIHTAEQVSYNC